MMQMGGAPMGAPLSCGQFPRGKVIGKAILDQTPAGKMVFGPVVDWHIMVIAV